MSLERHVRQLGPADRRCGAGSRLALAAEALASGSPLPGLTGAPPFGAAPDFVLLCYNLDWSLLLALAAVVAKAVVRGRAERRAVCGMVCSPLVGMSA